MIGKNIAAMDVLDVNSVVIVLTRMMKSSVTCLLENTSSLTLVPIHADKPDSFQITILA
jgi:hypothetical protein